MTSMKSAFEGESSEDEKEDCNKLKVNESFAKNYDIWRRKEEYQKLKDKYGEIDSESEESSSDNELAGTECPEFDMDFFRVVAALELKHPILNEDRNFFKDNYKFKREGDLEEGEKPLTLKDYERKIILEKGGVYEDEQMPSTSYEESDFPLNDKVTKKGCGFDDDNVSDEDDDEEKNKISVSGLFTKQEKTIANEAVEESQTNYAVSFLKGKKTTLDNKVDEELLGGLKKAWKEKMSNEDKFLMDYFVNERYLEEEDDAINRSPHHFAFDPETMSDDEKTFTAMEEFESKYRFRYEEPDEEFIKSHPRTIDDSIRAKADKRKEMRNRRQVRLEEAAERKAQEISRLKSFKKKEIMERIEKLQEIAGAQDMNFEEMDLDADFDPEKHDKVMNEMFNDDYYEDGQEERDKPSIEDEELKRELEEEYAKLDNLDSMTEGGYRYEKVEPNNFGLSTEEILMAKDTELNRWYSLKKMLRQERTKEMELRELKNYCHRASMPDIKKKILPSLFADNVEDVWAAEEERKRVRNLKKKERKLRKKEVEETSALIEPLNEIDETTKTETKSKKKLKKKEMARDEIIEITDVTKDTNELDQSQEILSGKKKKIKKHRVTEENINEEIECDENMEIRKKKKKRKHHERDTDALLNQDINDQINNDSDGSKTKKSKMLKLDEITENFIQEEECEKSPKKQASKKKQKLRLEHSENTTHSASELNIITPEIQTSIQNAKSLNSPKKKASKKKQKLHLEHIENTTHSASELNIITPEIQTSIQNTKSLNSPKKKASKKKQKLHLEPIENTTHSAYELNIIIPEIQTSIQNTKSPNSSKLRKNKSLINDQINHNDKTFNSNYINSQLSHSNKSGKKKHRADNSCKQLPTLNEKESELKGITDARLAAYGANPKRLRKKLKYSN